MEFRAVIMNAREIDLKSQGRKGNHELKRIEVALTTFVMRHVYGPQSSLDL